MARLFCGGEVIVDDWSPLDGVPSPEFIPPAWNGPHVGNRFVDACRTLIHMPATGLGPGGFGSCWPGYRIEWDDLVAMVGAELEQLQREINHTRTVPTSKQISELDRAIGWAGAYLREREDCALAFNLVGRAKAVDVDLHHLIRRRGYAMSAHRAQQLNWEACEIIANGLNAREEQVF